MEKIKMEIGKIYFISFGSSTQLVARYKADDACNYLFFDTIHYWNSYETYHRNGSAANHDTFAVDRNGKIEVVSSYLLKFAYSRNTWVNAYTHFMPITKPQPPTP